METQAGMTELKRPLSRLALWSFLVSLMVFFPIISGTVAIILGAAGMAVTSRQPEMKGKGFAMVGIGLGLLQLLFALAVVGVLLSVSELWSDVRGLGATGLMASGRYQEAAAQYRKLIARTPKPLENLIADGVQTSRVTRPDAIMAYHGLGKALLLNDDTEEALEAYTSFETLAGAVLGMARYSKGSALLRLERYDEAMQLFDEAIQLDPELYDAHQNRCATLRLLGRYEEAVGACQQTIGKFPGIAKSHVSLGWAYELWGRPEEAVDAYLEAIRLAPGWEFPRVRMIQTLQAVGSDQDRWNVLVQRITVQDGDLAAHVAQRAVTRATSEAEHQRDAGDGSVFSDLQ